MVDVTIYSKEGIEKAVVKSLEYDGTFMGDRYVSVSVSSPTVIDWAIGDYLDYRGERWTLWLLPATSKVARVTSYGGAIEYKDVRFCPTEEELRRCSFLDVVLHDNEIHYTNLPNFSFYCATAKDLADRIQANLDRLYPGQWTITANPAVSITDQSLTFSNNSCWEALAMANTSLGLNFIVDSANREIVIGGEGAFIETVMEYGKGNGLKSVDRTVDDNQQVINRLYAYGNTRNLPYRYYNKRYSAGSSVYDAVQSMYLPNLMLPGICKGWDADDAVNYLDENGCVYKIYGSEGQELTYNESTHWFDNLDGTPYVGTEYKLWKHFSLCEDGTKYYCDRVWIESVDSVKKCGIQEGSKFFDGSDELVDDIYPSITGFSSTEELAEALGDEEATVQNLSYEQGELFAIIGADVESWDGIIPEEQETTPSFYIRIKNIGFDMSDAELDAGGDTPRLSMKSGMCTGREFNILECKKQVYSGGSWSDYDDANPVSGPWSYYLKCEVAADDSIGQYFPNDSFALAAGDKFVILGIRMPDVYVDVAELRLLKAAIVWLSENDKTAYNYAPSINNIYMSENPETSALLKEGNVLHIYDADLDIDVEMTISQFKIKNDKQIPEYEVTLSNDKEADLVQRVTAQVQQTYGQFLGSGKGGGSSIYLIGSTSNTAPTDNNAFSARRSLRMFLRKDVNDVATGKITFNGGTDTKSGADFTDERGYLSGWLGYGARINGNGTAEFEEVNIRGALRAAELVFNKISAEEGESIRSIGHGEILTVTPTNSTTGTATLKLDGDEWANIEAEDICRGLYNTVNKAYDNAQSDGFDANGFRLKAGFFASYFEITSVTSSKGQCTFTYRLQENTTEHPCPMMKFAIYGNFNRQNLDSKKKRQSSIYTTAVGIAPRRLYLAGVNDWQIKPENIKIADGYIEGLSVWEEISAEQSQQYDSSEVETYIGTDGETHYKHLTSLVGDAGFYCEDNIYLGGIIDHIRSIAAEEVAAQVSNIGQSWIMSIPSDRYVIDCYEDGSSIEYKELVFTASLYFGNELCTLDASNCWIEDGRSYTHPNILPDGTTATKQITVQEGEIVESRLLSFSLSGTLNGNTYTTVKTIALVANRQGVTGEQGEDGLGAVRVDSNEEYFVVYCAADGKVIERTPFELEVSLKVGDTAIPLKTSPMLTCYYTYNNSTRSPFLYKDENTVAYKTIYAQAGYAPGDTIFVNLVGTYENKEYTVTKRIHVIAVKKGESGQKGSFKSTAFMRTNTDISGTTLSGGDYDNPIPNGGWSDGIPAGEEILWAATCTFYGDGTDSGWSSPRKMTDTATYDVEFSPNETRPENPSNVVSERVSQGWYDPDSTLPEGLSWENMKWRAEKECKNGQWGDWIVVRIKGEKGDDGSGIESITTYYLLTIKYQGVQVSDFGSSTTYSLPTASLPYLWRYTRYIYTDGYTYDTSPELIATYSDRPNTNLLDDTSFLDLDSMDAWTYKGALINNTSTPIYYEVGASDGEFNVRYKGNGSAGEAGYIEYLVQPIDGKVLPSSWYTLSFEIIGGHQTALVSTNKSFWLDFNMEGVFDASAHRFIDGTETASTMTTLHFTPTETWTRHTITFKTPQNMGSDMSIKLRMYTRKTDDYITLRKPKLEVGLIATEYINGNVSRQPMARAATWEVGKQYFKGALGENYMDIVALDGKWYRCLKTHTSNDDNKPRAGRVTTYWQPADSFDFIATDLLLADQAVVNLMFSQKILMHNDKNQLTASINENGDGGYCIYYPDSGRKMMEFSSEGYIKYYNDNDGNTLEWKLGLGGSIIGHNSDDWKPIMLYKLPSNGVNFTSGTTFNRDEYYMFIDGDLHNYVAYDGAVYETHTNNDPTDLTANGVAATGWYTPNLMPWERVADDGETTVYAITMYRIVKSTSSPRVAKITQTWTRYYDGESYTNIQDS